MGEHAVGPLAVGQRHRRKRTVFFDSIFEHDWFGLWRRRFLLRSTKNPTAGWAVGLANLATKLEPNCRAGKQRVRKQQVQVAIHAVNLAVWSAGVNWISGP
jgi:hypothetical protein